MSKRIAYIDHLRGIAILLVVIGHFIQSNTIESKDNDLFNVIYSFHMPLFMFISGYVGFLTMKPKIFENYLNFVLNKGRTLLLPFFAWPLIADKFFFKTVVPNDFSASLTSLLADPRIGLWFLWYLFFNSILFSVFLFLSTKFNKKDNLLVDVFFLGILLALLGALRILKVAVYLDSFIQYFGYFFLGVFLSKFLWFKNLVMDVRAFSFFLILFIVSVGHYSFNDPGFHNMGFSLIIRIVAAICAIFSLYYVVRQISWLPFADRYITLFGTTSIVIYTTHFKFIELFGGSYFLPHLNVFLLILMSGLCAVLIIFLCIGISRVVKLCSPLDTILYGSKLVWLKKQHKTVL